MQANKAMFPVNIIEKSGLSLQVLLKLYFGRDLNVFSHIKLGDHDLELFSIRIRPYLSICIYERISAYGRI
jgi:hypothetical protein